MQIQLALVGLARKVPPPSLQFGPDFPFSCWDKALSIPDFSLLSMQKAALFRAAYLVADLPATIYLGWIP
jgi:hypothetical protein